MSNQMITFSFRTTPEAVQKLKKHAQKRKTSCGAVLREILKEILVEEKEDESGHRKNHSGGRNSSCPGGLCPDESPGPRD